MNGRRLQAGEAFAGYRIRGLLHEGGMATLYDIEPPAGAPPLLLKIPRLEFGSHPGCLVGFEMERMILDRLRGPHAPRLVASGSQDDTPWLVMERIEGENLTAIAARAPLPAGEVARIVGAVAKAVHALHGQNVIHLDLKPGNVMLRPDGCAVLIDFGLARHAELPDLVGEEYPIPAGSGTAISPEQLSGIRSDPRSDVFALGVLAYRLATGELPFGDPGGRLAMRRRLYIDPLPPRAVRSELPAWLQEAILRCLEIRPERRYATAAQLAHDLAHPDLIPLSGRAGRLKRCGPLEVGRRLLRLFGKVAAPPATPARHLAHAPHVLVAIDPQDKREALAEAMRDALRRTRIAEPDLRVTLMASLPPQPFGEESILELEYSRQTAILIALRHWAAPLGLPPDKLRIHLAENSDPATALLEYAAAHHVDRIIVGARSHSALRRYLGSVSARVVAEAACTVTVVRPR
jgi:nucleotide-binding universal stress UspA family protein